MPDYTLEGAIQGKVAGIDEAGRGPWAGPVVAAAVILDPTCIPEGLDDSKKLSRNRRESLYETILHSAITGIGIASVEEIDQYNILEATKRAMVRAWEALGQMTALVLVDGNQPPRFPCPCQAVIGGDGKSLSIAAASILAKVTRDRIMATLANEFPSYGWGKNAGYGTKIHQEAIASFGITPHHRKSFAPIRNHLLGAAA